MKYDQSIRRYRFCVDREHPFGCLVADKNGPVVLHDHLPAALVMTKKANEKLIEELTELHNQLANAKTEIAKLRFLRDTNENNPVWYWEGDGYDNPQTIVCPIVINPVDLIKLINSGKG